MSFQTHNTFFRLQNTNKDIFQSAFWPSIDSNTTAAFKTQKVSNDIVKIVLVTSVVQTQFYEITFCALRKQK